MCDDLLKMVRSYGDFCALEAHADAMDRMKTVKRYGEKAAEMLKKIEDEIKLRFSETHHEISNRA